MHGKFVSLQNSGTFYSCLNLEKLEGYVVIFASLLDTILPYKGVLGKLHNIIIYTISLHHWPQGGSQK